MGLLSTTSTLNTTLPVLFRKRRNEIKGVTQRLTYGYIGANRLMF